MVREEISGEVQRASGLCGAQCLRERPGVRARNRDGEHHGAEGADQGAGNRLVQELVGSSRHLPARGRLALAQLVAAADDPQVYEGRADAVRRRGRLYAWRKLNGIDASQLRRREAKRQETGELGAMNV